MNRCLLITKTNVVSCQDVDHEASMICQLNNYTCCECATSRSRHQHNENLQLSPSVGLWISFLNHIFILKLRLSQNISIIKTFLITFRSSVLHFLLFVLDINEQLHMKCMVSFITQFKFWTTDLLTRGW